jgi:pentatricopeptide repeat protein
MPARVDVVTCSSAIYQNARRGLFDEAVGLFVGMVRAGVCPNSFTLVGASLAAAGLGDAVLTECLHGWAVRCRLDSNPLSEPRCLIRMPNVAAPLRRGLCLVK